MIDIDHILCDGCGVCVDACPTDAIVLHAGKACIEQELCKECQACVNICPQGAILLVEQIHLGEKETEKPYSAPVPETIMSDRSSVVSSLLGAVVDSVLAINSPAKRNQPNQIVGRRRRNRLGQRGRHRQHKRRHKNNGRK